MWDCVEDGKALLRSCCLCVEDGRVLLWSSCLCVEDGKALLRSCCLVVELDVEAAPEHLLFRGVRK